MAFLMGPETSTLLYTNQGKQLIIVYAQNKSTMKAFFLDFSNCLKNSEQQSKSCLDCFCIAIFNALIQSNF